MGLAQGILHTLARSSACHGLARLRSPDRHIRASESHSFSMYCHSHHPALQEGEKEEEKKKVYFSSYCP